MTQCVLVSISDLEIAAPSRQQRFQRDVMPSPVPKGRRNLAGGESHRNRSFLTLAPEGRVPRHFARFLRPFRGESWRGRVPVAFATG